MIQTNKIINSFIWKLLERFSSQAISLLVTILLARILLPIEFGIIAIIVVFIELANVIIDGGLCTALIQKKGADDIDFSTIMYFSLVLAGVLYLLLYILAPTIANFYDNTLLTPVLRILSINLFLNSFNAIQRAYISKHMLFDKLFYCSLVAIVVSGTTGIVMAYSGYGVWALVAQQITNQFVLSVIMWFTIKWRPLFVFSKERFKTLFDYGWKIFLSNLIIALYENVRSLIIGKMYHPSALAFFDRGKQFPNLIMTNINISLQTVLLPAFAEIQEQKELVRQMMKKSIELTNFCTLPLLVGLAVAAKPLVILLLTDKWIEAVPFIQIFSIAFMMMPIQSSNMSAIKALGYSNITLKIEIIKKVIETIILVISFFISVYAVAWGIVLYNFICIIINLYPCKKILNYNLYEQFRAVIPYLLSSLAMGFALYILTFFDFSNGLLLALQIVLGLFIYIILNAVFKTNSFMFVKNMIAKKYYTFHLK